MIQNEKKFRPHTSSLGLDANKTAVLAVIIPAVLALIPYVRYFGWIVPLVMFLTEQKSDFVRFYEAQSFILYLFYGIITVLIDVPVAYGIKLMGSSMIVGLNISAGFLSLFITLLTAVIAVIFLVLSIMAAKRAYSYIQARIILAGTLGEKILLRS